MTENLILPTNGRRMARNSILQLCSSYYSDCIVLLYLCQQHIQQNGSYIVAGVLVIHLAFLGVIWKLWAIAPLI